MLLLRTTVDPEADVELAAYPFELEAISRATTWCPLPEVCVLTCSASTCWCVALRPSAVGHHFGALEERGRVARGLS